MATTMESPLVKEFEWYLANQAALVAKYNGRVIAIKDGVVLGDYADAQSAIAETAKHHELGTFLVQVVEPGDTAYRQSFHSRVSFSR